MLFRSSRMHYSMKQEFKLLKAIIADYAPEDYDYDPVDGGRAAKKSDYDSTDVIPVSDPNAATMAQKIVQYQAVLQLAQTAPQLYDMPQLHRQMIEVLGIKNAEKLVKTEDDQVPTDPVQENQNILNGTPVKAFVEQNHEAHIRVHMMAMQDPKIAQIIGQNPQAQAIMQAFQAHIAEHVGFAYRKQIEVALGVPLPPPDEEMSPELEAQVAPLLAQAAQQVLANAQQVQQAQAAQQAAQDPVVQQQQQELALRQQELADKKQIEMAKIQKDLIIADKVDATKIQLQEMKDHVTGFQTGFNAMVKNAEREHGANESEKSRQFTAAQAANKGGQE